MFTWLNKQGVRSSEGFEVQQTERFKAEYRESGVVITVDVEGSGGNLFFDPESFSRHARSKADEDRMIRNFTAAIEFQGLKAVPGLNW